MNRLSGTVDVIETQGSIALIDVRVGPHRLTATLIGYPPGLPDWPRGRPVELMFKETDVAIGKDLSGLLSLRNRLPCSVVALETGALLTRVGLCFDGWTLEAVITTRSARRLDLRAGDAVEALIKASEMTLLLEPGR